MITSHSDTGLCIVGAQARRHRRRLHWCASAPGPVPSHAKCALELGAVPDEAAASRGPEKAQTGEVKVCRASRHHQPAWPSGCQKVAN